MKCDNSELNVGPINAVAATTLAIVNFKPKLIINQGTAGANDPRIISDSEFHAPKLEEAAGEYCAAFVVDMIKRIK